MRGYSISGVYDVYDVYNYMMKSDVRPDDHTFPCVIKACADHGEGQKGREIHGCSIKVGFDKLVYVGNTLLLFYSSCCDLVGAQNVFEEMPERDVVSWNTMIGVFSGNGWSKQAVGVYLGMVASGFLPNAVSVVSVLPACAELKDEVMARMIHCYVVKVGLVYQVRVGNAFVDVYGKCGKLDSSQQVFDEMVEKNGVSWNAIITSFAHAKCYSDALHMFKLMIDSKEKPNDVTLSSLLPVLVELEYFDAGKEVHGLSTRMGLDSDLFIANSLIDMYAKAGESAKASSIFQKMSVKNVVSWNAMIANFAHNKDELAAIGLVRRMQACGETPNAVTFTNVLPACARIGAVLSGKEIHARCIRKGASDHDIFLSNALIDMYAKCNLVELAQNVFDISLRDQISYNTLIVGYSQTTECLKSLNLFKEMGFMGMERDTVSFVGAIAACANSAALKSGKEIHAFIIRRLFHTHHFISNSLLDLYMKCGKIDLAQKIFERVHKKDIASWNTMILGYGMLGNFEKAISLFEAMREDTVNHDSISFIAVLSACSHGGLVEEGKKYFEEMKAKGIMPKNMHYTCMIDLLGRAGLMEEVVEVIRELPFEPDANIWGALLGASRIHGNIELAKWAAEQLFVLKPDHSGYYLLLSNMLAEAGRWDEATRVRELMKSRGVKKDPAYSWVQNRDQVRAFLVGES